MAYSIRTKCHLHDIGYNGSASVVDNAISVCIFDVQCMGHPAYVIIYPILDLAEFGLSDAVLLFHSDPEPCFSSKNALSDYYDGI